MIYYFLAGIIPKNDIAYKYLKKLYYNTTNNIKECCSYSCSNKQSDFYIYCFGGYYCSHECVINIKMYLENYWYSYYDN
jgi:hypothetical protein